MTALRLKLSEHDRATLHTCANLGITMPKNHGTALPLRFDFAIWRSYDDIPYYPAEARSMIFIDILADKNKHHPIRIWNRNFHRIQSRSHSTMSDIIRTIGKVTTELKHGLWAPTISSALFDCSLCDQQRE